MTKRPTKREISYDIRAEISIDLPDGEVDEVISAAEDLCDQAYDAGYNEGCDDGAIRYEDEHPPINEEKLNANFVVENFGDCKTLEDFQDAYKWVFITHCNWMTI